MNSYTKHSGAILAAILALLFSAMAAAQEQPAAHMQMQTPAQTPRPTPVGAPIPAADKESGWHFSLSPYIWFAGAHGTVGALGHDASVHVSAGDLLSHFNFGLMGTAEARYNRIVLYGDLLWIRLADSKAVPFPLLGASTAEVRVGQFMWTSKVGYRVMNGEHFKVDGTVGLRYWHLGQKLFFNPSLLGINFQGAQNWADILIGGRVQLPVGTGEKAVVNLVGDVGGWGAAAKLDYQFATVLGYKLCPKWTLQAGYRYLFIDYRRNNGVYNMVTTGPLLGVTYTFK